VFADEAAGAEICFIGFLLKHRRNTLTHFCCISRKSTPRLIRRRLCVHSPVIPGTILITESPD